MFLQCQAVYFEFLYLKDTNVNLKSLQNYKNFRINISKDKRLVGKMRQIVGLGLAFSCALTKHFKPRNQVLKEFLCALLWYSFFYKHICSFLGKNVQTNKKKKHSGASVFSDPTSTYRNQNQMQSSTAEHSIWSL